MGVPEREVRMRGMLAFGHSAFSMWTLVLSEAGLVSALHAGSPCTVDTAAPGKERARCSEDASARCTPNLPGLVRWAGTQKVLRGTEPNSCVSGGQLGTAPALGSLPAEASSGPLPAAPSVLRSEASTGPLSAAPSGLLLPPRGGTSIYTDTVSNHIKGEKKDEEEVPAWSIPGSPCEVRAEGRGWLLDSGAPELQGALRQLHTGCWVFMQRGHLSVLLNKKSKLITPSPLFKGKLKV
ncbi:uncharacterized protein LOC134474974 isoform X1 [Cavia porcellus]|uniref:uncharacterized protein LOC134474974 isoform X1 n=1 Tax=Cavia porcellus TaxID=10141 RepID=UPI002FE06527